MDYMFPVNVMQCIHFKHEENFNTIARTVMDYEFDFCIGCEREMWLDNKYYKIDKGHFIIRTPGQKVYTKGRYDCYMLTLDFSERSLSPNYSRNSATQKQAIFDSKIWSIVPSVFQPLHYDDYCRIFKSLLAINDIDINENPRTLSLVNQLLHLLITDALFHLSPSENKSNNPLDEACKYIKKHFAEEISLNCIAMHLHMNKNHLVRQFKKNLGISPIAYLIKIRMDYAKKLLVETNLPIKTISILCGYNNPSFFNSYFKKEHGVTPMSYRYSQQNS